MARSLSRRADAGGADFVQAARTVRRSTPAVLGSAGGDRAGTRDSVR